MSRTTFAILMISFAAIVLLGMWIAWRGRTRRDASLRVPNPALVGDVIAEFAHASYVSTTPVGSPLERVAVPGLRFKGFADLTVRADGVTIAVTGEAPVHLIAQQLRGTATASGRVGKFVEQHGLALLRWQPETPAAGEPAREFESSFRFTDAAEQQRFTDAIDRIAPAQTPQYRTTQEEA